MSQFAQDVFAEAKARGLHVGFVGTYADLKAALDDDDAAHWEAHCQAEGERWAESRASAWFENRGADEPDEAGIGWLEEFYAEAERESEAAFIRRHGPNIL